MGEKDIFNERTHLLTNDDGPSKAPGGLGRRHLVAVLAFLGMVVSYSVRFNLSVALVAMVRVNTSQTVSALNVSDTADTCPQTEALLGGPQTGEFDWDADTQGLILSSFFYGYIVTQVVGGELAQRWGGKAVFGVGLGVTALLTVLTPVLARAHVGLLIATRVLEGVAEGVTLPAMYLILSKWSPSSEKTFIGSCALMGTNVGTVVATALSGYLAQYAPDGGWPYCFYVFGGLGLVWFVAWMFLISESPSVHPSISDAERDYIVHTAGKREKSPPTPWRRMLTSLPVWGAVVGHTCKNWVYYTLVTTLPSYFQQVLKFNISQNGLVSALPFVVMPFIELGGSLAADKLRERRLLSTTNVRKVYTALGLFAPALFLVVEGYVGCDQVTSVVILCCATGFLALVTSGACINYLDVAPIHVGTMYGLGNTFATIPGMVSPSIVSAVTNAQPYISRWRTVFFISAAVSVAGGIFYLFVCSGEQQTWDKVTYQQVEDGTQEEDNTKEQSDHFDLKIKDKRR